MLFENISDFDKVTQLNAKLVKEITGKIDSYTPIIQKYLLEGIDKFIGDCKDPKEFLSIWELMNHIIALPMANIIVGEEVASHEDVVKSFGVFVFDIGRIRTIPPIFSFIHPKLHDFFTFEIWVESNFTSSKNYDQSHKTGDRKTYQGEKNARQRL
ncbi:1652_t:CDS:2 [Rhizophagus irregularis]|nr:1652_t:CDS:2 [Rhizophagus irregularis]